MSDSGSIDNIAFSKFLENQKQELAIREKEIELERDKALAASQADERSFRYAQQQLEAMERDRHDDRVYREILEKKSFWIYIVFVIAVAVFLTAAVLKDKDAMIIELVKVVAYGAPCGIGGYTIGRYKKKNDESGQSQQ
jgi:hypothetical protein